MTLKQLYEYTLVELNKVQAPSILLEDFNYFINKAVNQYINKRYNIYDTSLQTSDDLRVLKSTAMLEPTLITGDAADLDYYGQTYEVALPSDYLHILNCLCQFKTNKTYKCYDKNDLLRFPATRLTSDMWGLIVNNFYMKPSYKKPYYFIHNVNTNTTLPTNPQPTILVESKCEVSFTINPTVNSFSTLKIQFNPITGEISSTNLGINKINTITIYTEGGKNYVPAESIKYVHDLLKNGKIKSIKYATGGVFDLLEATTGEISVINQTHTVLQTTTVPQDALNWTDGELPKTITIGGNSHSLVEKEATNRYGNASSVRCEIRCGWDKSNTFTLNRIYVDYIKSPQFLRLTQTQLDTIEDISLIMEFPDYVCQEIINELTNIIMENASDPRLQTHIPISTSIANPAQALAQSALATALA